MIFLANYHITKNTGGIEFCLEDVLEIETVKIWCLHEPRLDLCSAKIAEHLHERYLHILC